MHVIKCTNVFGQDDASRATESEIYTVGTYSILIRSRSLHIDYNLNVAFHFTPHFVELSFLLASIQIYLTECSGRSMPIYLAVFRTQGKSLSSDTC